ncbi:MAG: class I SAM-dependent methyltransferase [Anaerolineales bacterium]|nr:class I SAM-dependent methyltransferase [Anaerolineales bacterium]
MLESTNRDAQKWNKRFTESRTSWLRAQPRQLLIDFAYLLPSSGLALDAAAGVATHGLFMAQRGLHVIALDISEVGLRLAKQQADAEGVWLETAVTDLSQPWLPANIFDVIVNFRFLQRETFPVYRTALKPGGLLIFETFVRTEQTSHDAAYYLEPGELHAAFSDWNIVHYAEINGRSRRDNHQKCAAQLVAYKPISGS